MDLNELKKLINEEVKRTRQRNLLKESEGETNPGFVGKKPKVSQGCPEGQIFDPDTGNCVEAPEMSKIEKIKNLSVEDLRAKKNDLLNYINNDLQQKNLSNLKFSSEDDENEILSKSLKLSRLSDTYDLQDVRNAVDDLWLVQKNLKKIDPDYAEKRSQEIKKAFGTEVAINMMRQRTDKPNPGVTATIVNPNATTRIAPKP